MHGRLHDATYPDDVVQKGHATSTAKPRERAVLVGIERAGADWKLESSLAELERLAFTAGADVVGTATQKMSSPNPATFVGTGKVQEVRELALACEADVVIFDDELTPSQQANLERAMPESMKVIDRTALILDIFALHAKSKEGRLQVRLAQNQYLYPRLRGMWAHLASNRMGGGVGSRFGEGESQLEVDRRIVRNRITSIRRELKTLSRVRSQQRSNRYESGVFKVALVGYTNAGKSSLLNAMCGSDVYSDDLLFATLDSTTRRLMLPEGREATLTDTVGFIQKLPTTLVEAFKSTLDEIGGADLLLHVVDASSPDYLQQIDSVCDVLQQIAATEKPRILVFNKADLLEDDVLDAMTRRYPEARFTSSVTGFGSTELVEAVSRAAASKDARMSVLIPFERGELVSLAHRRCHVVTEAYTEKGVEMSIRVPRELQDRFEPFVG